MATPNRSTLINKLQKVLKKHYKPQSPDTSRNTLELLLYACLLENAAYAAADQAFQLLKDEYFDWNEVRVSSVRELSEVMHMLPDPAAAANRLKRSLQGIFEALYSFDLEMLKKQKLGQAAQQLEKFGGSSPFVVAYVTQSALGGHAIPLDSGALDAMLVLGIINADERAAGTVPTLERTVAKSKGIEFGSLLHQLSADFVANPYSPALHKILLEIAPEAKENLPKKGAKAAAKAAAAEAAGKAKKKAAAKPAAPKPAKGAETKKASPKAATKPAEPKKPTAKKAPRKTTAKPASPSGAAASKAAKRKPR